MRTPNRTTIPTLSASTAFTRDTVLNRLYARHPRLTIPPTELLRFERKLALLPDLPEWIWFGILNYSCSSTSGVCTFTALDHVLDTYMAHPDSKELWNMLFYYMYLQIESPQPHTPPPTPPRKKLSQGITIWWLYYGMIMVFAAAAVVAALMESGAVGFVEKCLPERLR